MDIFLKFGKQRKAQEYTIYPEAEGKITFQSDKAIGVLDVNTNEAIYTDKGAYSPFLIFAKKINITQEQIDLIKNNAPKKGQHIGLNIYHAT